MATGGQEVASSSLASPTISDLRERIAVQASYADASCVVTAK
jgi:hypothetical protein